MNLKNVPLSDRIKELLLGSLLGDGSLKISDGYVNARFSFRHSIIQKEYFELKVAMLEDISSDHCVFLQKADGYSRNQKLRYQSLALPALSEMFNLTHTNGRLDIQRRWLNCMTPFSLAIWWFDDGSLIANGRKGVFCTDGFDEKSVKILAQYLQVVWNIQTHIASIGRKRDGTQKEYWRLWIRSTEELKKFLRIILPYTLVKSMLSKVLLLYNDDHLQQRWISEVVHLTGFSKAIIEKMLVEKKSKWKHFRE